MGARKERPALPGGGTPAQCYAAMLETLEREMGAGPLANLLSSTRQTGVTESLPITEDDGALRLMGRLGWLEGLKGAERVKRAEEWIRDFAAGVERTPAMVSVVFRIYADGLYGVFPAGVCGNPPRCAVCGLTRRCAAYNAPPSPSARQKTLAPAERLRQDGPSALSDEELLSLVIGSGKTASAPDRVARELLDRYGSLRKLAQASCAELESYAAVSRPAAARIRAAFALAGRMADEKRRLGPAVRCGKDFYDLYHGRLRDLRQEVFWVILLDQRNRVLREEQVSQGSLASALVHPREVFAPAIRESAAAVALVHNHPSGDATPSEEDIRITRRLAETAKVVSIRLLDHVIIGEGVYTSFVDEDLF